MYPPRLTEKVEEHPGMIRIKGCKAMYDMEERKGAPASNAIARLYAFEEKYEHPDAITKEMVVQKEGVWHVKQQHGQLISRRCSECGRAMTQTIAKTPAKFCWNCVAKMSQEKGQQS